MIEISTHIESANGTAYGTVDAREGGRLLHSDRFDLASAVSRRRFAQAVATKIKSPGSVTEIENLLVTELDRIRAEEKDKPQDAEPKSRAPGWSPPEDQIISRAEPLRLAEHLINARFKDPEGNTLIRRYRKEWWIFEAGKYACKEVEPIRSIIYLHLDRLWVRVRDKQGIPTGEFRKINPKTTDVREVENAMTACGTIAEGDMPQWLDRRTSPVPQDVIAFRNGLLDTTLYRSEAMGLMPATPDWFSGVCCPYAFDPDAKCPLTLQTLNEIFNGRQDCIALLQEWMGLQLVPDNRYEKLMLLVGRPRSGKGTVISMMNAMLGSKNVVSTNFAKLASRFGLHPLIGKLSAILPDAHIGRSVDAMAALEAIKSITGNDLQGVDRKGVDELPQVHLFARFMIAVNELPRLPDTAGALKPRLLLLYFPNSYADREDTTIKSRISAEAQGIAAWAIEGLFRLREQGGFTIPESSRSIIEEFERTVSPVKCFLHERCEVVAGAYIEKSELYAAWELWCKARGDEQGNMSRFSQQLIAADPAVTTSRRGPRGQQFTTYEGVKLC
jgi:putative DNA primase/helicase